MLHCLVLLSYALGRKSSSVSLPAVSFPKPIPRKRMSVEDLHNLAIKRRCNATVISNATVQEQPGPDCVMSPPSSTVSSSSCSIPLHISREQSGPDISTSGSRKRVHSGPVQTSPSGACNTTTAGSDDPSVARAAPKRKSNPVHPKSLKRKLRGPYGSDPDARASHSLRSRTDPLASLQRLRATPLDPFLGTPTNTQHPNTVVEPDD